MMAQAPPTDNEVLRAIEILEESRISFLNFDFITENEIANFLHVDPQDINDVLLRLKEDHKIILVIGADGTSVKSKIGSLIFNLFKLKTRYAGDQTNPKNAMPCTADIKYIRYEKPRPVRTISLLSVLDYNKESLEYKDTTDVHDELLRKLIRRLAIEKPRISQFQKTTTQKILKNLSSGKSVSEGIGVVADTGTGKTFAYQLPLILWILHKKCKIYYALKKAGKKVPAGMCLAMLLFPRNALNQNQLGDFQSIVNIANEVINDSDNDDDEFRQLMKVKIAPDFDQQLSGDLPKYYHWTKHDVIFTNTDTLKKRLYNPICHETYKYGIDLIVADEIHLSDGLMGAYTSGLFKRLDNLQNLQGKRTLFVGMTATINTPDKHCKKLFGLTNDVEIIDDIYDEKQHAFVEHHVIIKPIPGVHPIGMLLDATSCLIHNRRRLVHSNVAANIRADIRERRKTISFIQSTGHVFRSSDNLNDLEIFKFPNITGGDPFDRQYGGRYNPISQQTCDDCKNNLCIADSCDEYRNGNCWFFSENDGDPTGNTWTNLRDGTRRINYPGDNIRSKAMTGGRYKAERKNNQNAQQPQQPPPPDYVFTELDERIKYNDNATRLTINTEIDNIFATSVFEVGVDFGRVQEITMAGTMRSPSSYKQRAGRGGRNGRDDVGEYEPGLVVLTVIESDPISNFYFKHFDRLIYPELSPLKLETRNPNILATQCFSSIFDFLASKPDIDLINCVRDSRDPQTRQYNSQNILGEYKKAKNILKNDRADVEKHLEGFLSNVLGANEKADRDEIVKKSIENAESLLDKLSQNITIEQRHEPLAQWIAQASRPDTREQTLQSLQQAITGPAETIQQNTIEITENKKKINDVFQDILDKPYLREHKEDLEKFLKEWSDSL